jgi:hypothetical protein
MNGVVLVLPASGGGGGPRCPRAGRAGWWGHSAAPSTCSPEVYQLDARRNFFKFQASEKLKKLLKTAEICIIMRI